MTNEEFFDWLANPNARRTILFEVNSNANGVNVTRYLATYPYVTGPNDNPPNTYYDGVVRGGIEFKASLSLDGGSDVGFSDVEIDNSDGSLTSWLKEIWTNKPFYAFIGDVTWSRADFRLIFSGVSSSLDTVNRQTLNLQVRDKLARLEMPMSEAKLGGTGPNADALIPLAFGECHNVTPLVIDAPTHSMRWHVGQSERLIEARDGGIPIANADLTITLSSSRVNLKTNPYGDITLSVQGDSAGGYRNTVGMISRHIMMNYGTEPALRFTTADIDTQNILNFDQANPQPVGLFTNERMTVREAVDQLAGSVGARLTLGFDGLARLLKIGIPPPGQTIIVTESDMVDGSFEIIERLPVLASVKLNYCKNYTVQEGLLGSIPEHHKEMFKQEWLSVSASDPDVARDYGIWEEAEPENSLLLRGVDARPESNRRLNLRKRQRTIYGFIGYANLMFTRLGDPMQIFHWRYDEVLQGQVGQVVSLDVDWINSRIKIGVLM